MNFRICSLFLFSALATACVDDTTSATQAAASNGGRCTCLPPPLEALAACEGSTVDAACAFDFDGHHVTGTCKLSPEGEPPLACAPPR
jgi:hypothetical protein